MLPLKHINDVMQAEGKEFQITNSLLRQNPKPCSPGFKMYSLLAEAQGLQFSNTSPSVSFFGCVALQIRRVVFHLELLLHISCAGKGLLVFRANEGQQNEPYYCIVPHHPE